MEPLTKLPQPPQGSKEAVAYGIIDEVLNFVLNRHIHVLEENGYLSAKKYHADYGWSGDQKKKALALKHALMDEAQLKFSSLIAKSLKEPNQPLQHNASTGSVLSFESPARRG